MIEKMLEKFEELRMRYFLTIANGGDEKLDFAYGYIGETIDQCKEIVQEVAKEYEWIPVTERLPEPFQRVLVYDAWDDSMTIEHLQENDSFIYSVVAWMPLPIASYQKGE